MAQSPMTPAKTALQSISEATVWDDVAVEGAGITIGTLQNHIAKYKTAITSVHEDSTKLQSGCEAQEPYDTALASAPTVDDITQAELRMYEFEDDSGTGARDARREFQRLSNERKEAVTAHKNGTQDCRPQFNLDGDYDTDFDNVIGGPQSTPPSGTPPSDGSPPGSDMDSPGGDDEDSLGETELSSDQSGAQQPTSAQQQPQQQAAGGSPQQSPSASPQMSPTAASPNTPKFEPSKSDPSRSSSPLPSPGRTDLSSDKPSLDRGTSTTGTTNKDVSGKSNVSPALVSQANQQGQSNMRGGGMGMMPMGGQGMGGQRGGSSSGKKGKGGEILSADPDQLGGSTAAEAVSGGILSRETAEKKIDEVPHIMIIPETTGNK